MFAMAAAVAEVMGEEPTAVIFILDFKSSARTLSALLQLRGISGMSRSVVPIWLGVQLPRELNVDADRLSHPSKSEDVWLEAKRREFKVVWVEPSESFVGGSQRMWPLFR